MLIVTEEGRGKKIRMNRNQSKENLDDGYYHHGEKRRCIIRRDDNANENVRKNLIKKKFLSN